jgi:hypothetical protein
LLLEHLVTSVAPSQKGFATQIIKSWDWSGLNRRLVLGKLWRTSVHGAQSTNTKTIFQEGTDMEYKTLGNTGLLVSRLCLGTMTFGSGKGLFKFIGVIAEGCGITANIIVPAM